MAEQEYILTKEGVLKYQEELEYLKTVRRKEIAEKIKEARSFGDLSENAEYDEAKNEQAQVEDRILLLDHMLLNATIIEDNQGNEVIRLGSTVIIKRADKKNDETYTIVGFAEQNPLEGRLSNESPVGAALLGAKQGDKVKVETPRGMVEYKVLEIRG